MVIHFSSFASSGFVLHCQQPDLRADQNHPRWSRASLFGFLEYLYKLHCTAGLVGVRSAQSEPFRKITPLVGIFGTGFKGERVSGINRKTHPARNFAQLLITHGYEGKHTHTHMHTLLLRRKDRPLPSTCDRGVKVYKQTVTRLSRTSFPQKQASGLFTWKRCKTLLEWNIFLLLQLVPFSMLYVMKKVILCVLYNI